MTFSPILIGLIAVLLMALTVFLAYRMVRRQQEALKQEHKAVPSRNLVFAAGILTVLVYLGAVVAAILMLFAPFINLNLTGSVDDTTNLLVTLVIVLVVLGTGLYWLFVRLGLFSWKLLSLD